MANKQHGRVITFYSYKGGTGRSMALANIACILARQADEKAMKPILIIDWDLEAPGLHRYFQNYLLLQPTSSFTSIHEQPGLIELFAEVNELVHKSKASDDRLSEEEILEVLNRLPLSDWFVKTAIPSLFFLKAGRFDDYYPTRINTFNWERFYHRVPDFFRVFAQFLSEKYEYVLVDSRTGITDTSGICTTLIPDKLVVVFTPNRQSLTGITNLVRNATFYRKQSDDLRPLLVFPLVSRLEPTESVLRQRWRYGDTESILGYQPIFEGLCEEVYSIPKCSLQDYFDEVLLQHIPSFAYGEEIAVLSTARGDAFALTRRYESLTNYLVASTAPWERPQPTQLGSRSDAQPIRALEAGARLSDICPYPGLAAFTENDASFFFGRETSVQRLLKYLRGKPRFLAVLGSSGSGKTSFIRASLIPNIKAGALPGSDLWKVEVIQPTTDPFTQLSSLGFNKAAEDLPASAKRLLAAEKAPCLLLVIDQFEQLLVEAEQDKRERFIAQLVRLVESEVPCVIIIVMRDTFYSVFAQQFPQLLPWLEGALFNLPATIEQDEMRSMIAEPAHAVGLVFEEGLIDTILQDALRAAPSRAAIGQSADVAILPLLQFSLNQLWQMRKEGYLSHRDYQMIGGIIGGLEGTADAALFPLNSEMMAVARRVLTGLVQIGDEGQGFAAIRRSRPLSDFTTRKEDTEIVSKVVRHLIDSRLIRSTFDETAQQVTIELIHEAFIAHWAKFKTWLEEDRSFLQWRQRLTERSLEWAHAGRGSDYLLRGLPLMEAREYLERRPTDFGAQDYEFVRASINAAWYQRIFRWSIASLVLSVIFSSVVYSAILYREREVAATQAAERYKEVAAEKDRLMRLAQEEERKASEAMRMAEVQRVEAEKQEKLAGSRALVAEKARQDALAALERDKLTRTAVTQAQKGDLPSAAQALSEVISLYQRSGDVAAEATTLQNLAGLYSTQGQYEKALSAYQRALLLQEKAYGARDPRIVDLLQSVANVYRLKEDYARAETYYRRALEISQEAYGLDNPSVANSLNNLGRLYTLEGKYEQGESLYRKALAIYESVLGPEHLSTATSLNNIATLYASQGKYDTAVPLYERALAINEKALGSVHPSIAESLSNLAGIFASQGQFNKALPLYERALAINEKSLGPNHPSMVRVLNNLGKVYQELGQSKQAELYYQRALRSESQNIRQINQLPDLQKAE